MTYRDRPGLNDEIIKLVGLVPASKSINSSLTPTARVFKYPDLNKVFVMENDLYGNIMPTGSCFLAFHGTHGLTGKHLYIQTLSNASKAEIEEMVLSNMNT